MFIACACGCVLGGIKMSPAWALFQIVETWAFPWEVPPQRVGLPGHSSLRSAGPQFGWKVRVPYPWALLAPFLMMGGVLRILQDPGRGMVHTGQVTPGAQVGAIVSLADPGGGHRAWSEGTWLGQCRVWTQAD